MYTQRVKLQFFKSTLLVRYDAFLKSRFCPKTLSGPFPEPFDAYLLDWLLSNLNTAHSTIDRIKIGLRSRVAGPFRERLGKITAANWINGWKLRARVTP